ncbi:MAG: hypothetical protein FWE45_04330 [Firmicutes bacterium]|nr:hypothetical protein [Bacillota bacterium]
MPFNNEFIYNASKQVRVSSVGSDFEQAKKLIMSALEIVSKRTYYVSPTDVDIYIHGSYALDTNIYFPSNLEIVVELKKTPSYDPDDLPHKKYRLFNNYFVETSFEFNPVDFSKALFDALKELTGGNTTQREKFIHVPRQGSIKHNLEITPCFTFNYIEQDIPRKLSKQPGTPDFQSDTRIFRGVLLYDYKVKRHIFTFPKLHARNGSAKDIATQGNFIKMVRLFKTINKIGEREVNFDRTRGYFINCLLFNVPNELFILDESSKSKKHPLVATGKGRSIKQMPGEDEAKIFFRILNYLVNSDFASYVCQNLVWELFGLADEFWSIREAHTFVQNIKKFHDNFPADRTVLA